MKKNCNYTWVPPFLSLPPPSLIEFLYFELRIYQKPNPIKGRLFIEGGKNKGILEEEPTQSLAILNTFSFILKDEFSDKTF